MAGLRKSSENSKKHQLLGDSFPILKLLFRGKIQTFTLLTLEFSSQEHWVVYPEGCVLPAAATGILKHVNHVPSALPHENASLGLPATSGSCPALSASLPCVPPFTVCSRFDPGLALGTPYSLSLQGPCALGFLCRAYFCLVLITAPSSFSSWTFMFGSYFSTYLSSSPTACKLHGSKCCRSSLLPPSIQPSTMPGSETASCPPKSVLPTVIRFKLHIARCQLEHQFLLWLRG